MSTDKMSEIKGTPFVSGGIPWFDEEIDYDDDTEGVCPYCGYDGLSSHYHCSRCGEESSMMGHYRIINDTENGIYWEGFTCDVNNERGPEWPKNDDEVF